MKKLFKLFIAALFSILALAGCSPESNEMETSNTNDANKVYRTVEEIRDSGKIIIGVFSDKNPFGYVDQNGDYQGYDIELAERIGKDLGVEIEYVSTEAANRVEFLETGKVDLILANFTVTPERAEAVTFSLPYMQVSLGVVSPEDALITDLEQLAAKRLIVTKGTTADIYFTENHPEIELVKFEQYTEAFNALLDGRGDAFSTDNTEVLAWANANPGYAVGIDSLGEPSTIAPAVHKDNASLAEWVNGEIRTLGEENFFHKAYDKTLAPAYGDDVDPDSIVIEGGEIKAN